MAAANESQGLKIAVAIFATLAVILGVSTYFGFSSYGTAEAKFEDSEKKLRDQTSLATKLQNEFNSLKTTLGGNQYAAKEDLAGVDALLKEDVKALTKKVNEANSKIKDRLNQLRQAGVSAAQIDPLSQAADNLVNRLTNPSNTSVVSILDTAVDLMSNQAIMATEIAKDYIDTRRTLENTDSVNKQQLDVQVAENTRVKEELNKEQGDNESVRQGLIAKMDQLQTDNANQAQEIATMKNQLAMSKEEHDKRQGDLLRQLQVLRAQVEQKETVLDSKDGTVAFVDHSRGEIRSRDVTRRLGAREQMVFSVFDKDAPGLPTDKPKGTVQITQISEGGSVAKIVKTFDPLNPIRPGDQLYSAAWSPGSPKTFALIGKIDVDRDDRDDRADLKRLIEAAGGSVIYDLPPPGVGAESGELRPLTNWYVVDDRKPLRPPVDTAEERRTNEDEEAFNVKRTEALRSAWAMGIRPIAIESLLTWLGYTHRMRPFGRAEAVDRALVDELLFPGGRKGVLPGEEPAPSGDEMPAPDTEPAPDNAPAPDDRP